MPHLNPFAISGLLIAIAYLPLFILILIKGNNKLSKIYSLHILSVLLWGVGSFFVAINSNFEMSFFIWSFAYPPAIFIPIFFYHALLILFQKENPIILILLYLQGFYFIYSSLTYKMFDSMIFLFNSFYYYRGGSDYLISFIIWLIIVFISLSQLLSYYKKSYPEQKGQILALAFSSIGFTGGLLNFFPAFGFKIYPYGNFLIIIPSFIITYAILKHQLLEIEIVFRKSIAYSILITIISLAYLILVVISERLFQGVTGYSSIYTSALIAFGFGVILVPLRNKIEYLVNKLFFQKSKEEITKENELLRLEVAQTEKLKSVATLASGIAHEIKNPLTAIRTFTEYLPQKFDDKNFLEKFSKIVGKEVDRIDDLVHQLLEFAKPSPLTLKSINLTKLLEDTLNFLNSNFIKHGVKISTSFDKSVQISADSSQLKQAFLNILLNAIDAMPEGGTIDVSAVFKEADAVQIVVKDSGSGISKKDLKHIFDPFYTKKDSGTGLGLSITQRIIADHGGTISVESQEGKGTKFAVELPINQGKSI